MSVQLATLPPVTANASNAVALYPGRFPSVWAGRRELASAYLDEARRLHASLSA